MENTLKKVFLAILILAALLAGVYFFARNTAAQLAALDQPAETTETAETQVPETVSETVPETQPPETVPEVVPVHYDTVPNFYQTDYPYIKFGNGTIATSGCSMTCLAMVGSYLTDHTYMPDELAFHFGSYGKNNIERLEYGCAQLGLTYEKSFDWRDVRSAMENGRVAIIMVNGRSEFTTAQHFVVLSGLNEAGKITVNDPIRSNYDHYYLKTRFEGGFEDYDLIKGLAGAWIFDKNTIGEDFVPYDASIPEQPKTRYAGYNLPDEDVYTLACFACVAGEGKSEYLQQAILETVLNRMFSEEYPDTIDDVLNRTELRKYAEKMVYANPDYDSYRAVTAAMYGSYILPMDVLHYTKGSVEGDAWGEMEGVTFLYTR